MKDIKNAYWELCVCLDISKTHRCYAFESTLCIVLHVKVYLLVFYHFLQCRLYLRLIRRGEFCVNLFSKFGEVKTDIWHRILTQLQSQREQSLIEVVIVNLARDFLDQKDSVDSLCKLFMCIEFFSFSFERIFKPSLIETSSSLLFKLYH